MVNTQIEIKLTDDEDKVVSHHFVRRRTVGLDARRLRLTALIVDMELPDAEKSHMLSCACLASCVFNKKGELTYPDGDEKSDPLKAVYDIYENLDIDEYRALIDAHNELHPSEPTLKAKKKKS